MGYGGPVMDYGYNGHILIIGTAPPSRVIGKAHQSEMILPYKDRIKFTIHPLNQTSNPQNEAPIMMFIPEAALIWVPCEFLWI